MDPRHLKEGFYQLLSSDDVLVITQIKMPIGIKYKRAMQRCATLLLSPDKKFILCIDGDKLSIIATQLLHFKSKMFLTNITEHHQNYRSDYLGDGWIDMKVFNK